MSEPAPIPYTTVPKCPKCATALHRVSRECSSGSERWTAPAAAATRRSELFPDRPAFTSITGLPHILVREMPTDPDLPAITLDDAVSGPVDLAGYDLVIEGRST